MKKATALFLAIMMCLSLYACCGSDAPETLEHTETGELGEYSLYEIADRFIAFNGNSFVGVYENTDEAINALVDNPEDYRAVKSITGRMYHVLNLSDYIGKKIACIGDSLTYGVGADPNYVKNLENELGATVINLGTNGTVLCTGGHRTCQISMLTDSNLEEADIVTIYLGINDWDQAHNNENEVYYGLGDPDSTDTSTIYGAMKMWCDKIVELKDTEQYRDTKFFFITPHITSWNSSCMESKNWDQTKTNIHGYTLRDLCEAIIDVSESYGIPVIDVNKNSGMYYNSPKDENVTACGGDGVHPNVEGHKLITDCILRGFAEQ